MKVQGQIILDLLEMMYARSVAKTPHLVLMAAADNFLSNSNLKQVSETAGSKDMLLKKRQT